MVKNQNILTKSEGWVESIVYSPQMNSSHINYDIEDLYVPGTVSDEGKLISEDEYLHNYYNNPENPEQGSFYINLTLETIAIPEDYTVAAYSIDGGEKWKKAKYDTFSAAKFVKMLSKDMTLVLSNTAIDKETKKPGKDADGNNAVTVKFPLINKKPKFPKLVVNYLVSADPSGVSSGTWVMSEKDVNKAVKEGIEVGAAAGRAVDENGYGIFYDETGIPVPDAKKTYFVRTAPKKSGSTYTAASKPKRITIAAALKAPKYKVKAKAEKKNKDGTVKTPASAVIAVKKNTYVRVNGGAPKLYADKANLDVLKTTGTIELWTAATAKKPAGKKQTIER
jgi:hypothetical protein